MGFLKPFITGVPEDSLKIPRDVEEDTSSTGTISFTNAAPSGNGALTIPSKFNYYIISHISVIGDIEPDSTLDPGEVYLTFTLEHNGVKIISETKYFSWEEEGEIKVDFYFPMSYPLTLRKSDSLKVYVEASSFWNWNNFSGNCQIRHHGYN
jgi:hypothetical protein